MITKIIFSLIVDFPPPALTGNSPLVIKCLFIGVLSLNFVSTISIVFKIDLLHIKLFFTSTGETQYFLILKTLDNGCQMV